jgi:hypothetical protein
MLEWCKAFTNPLMTPNIPDIAEHVLDAERRQQEIFGAMTPAERWRQFLLLRETAWKLKRAGLKSLYPDLSDGEIETKVRDCFLNATT